MCYLCITQNPFSFVDPSTLNLQKKKERAKEIKAILILLENVPGNCPSGLEQINKLREEQYRLSQEI